MSVLWAVSALAMLVAASSAQDTPATYAVDGVVENSVTHQPVARVLVQAQAEAVLTDSEGRFELHLPAGFAQITLRRPGYNAGQNGGMAVQHGVRVAPNLPQLIFSITPLASISGRVTLSTGDDADGLRFALYRKRILEGHAHWMQEGNSATGNGGFRFLSLQAPASYVLCSAPSQDSFVGPDRRVLATGYPGTCYPGGGDFDSAIAAPLTLLPGQQAQLEISLVRQTFYPVAISVANAAQNSFIQLFDRDGRPAEAAMRRRSPGGTFLFDVPNGSYYAELRQGGTPQLYGRLDFIVAGAPLTGLTLVPTPVQPITVEVHREFTASDTTDGAIHRGNGVNELGLNLSLIPVDRPFAEPMGLGLRPPQGSSDDVYEMDAPPPGKYWVQMPAFEYYVSAMTSGATDLLHEPLTIGPGNSVEPIEITLRNDIGKLECSPKTLPAAAPSENPEEADMAPILVYAIPQSSGPQQRIYQSVMIPHAGPRFPFPLPPGAYLIVAFKEPHDIDLDDSEEMSRLAKEGQTVTIEPGAVTQVQIDPVPSTVQEASE